MAGNLIGFERFAVTSLYVTVGVGSTFVCRGTNPVAHFSPQCFLVGIARPSGWLDRHARPSRQSFLFLTNPSPVPVLQSPILRTPLGFGCRPCIGIYPAVCQQMCVARGGWSSLTGPPVHRLPKLGASSLTLLLHGICGCGGKRNRWHRLVRPRLAVRSPRTPGMVCEFPVFRRYSPCCKGQ